MLFLILRDVVLEVLGDLMSKEFVGTWGDSILLLNSFKEEILTEAFMELLPNLKRPILVLTSCRLRVNFGKSPHLLGTFLFKQGQPGDQMLHCEVDGLDPISIDVVKQINFLMKDVSMVLEDFDLLFKVILDVLQSLVEDLSSLGVQLDSISGLEEFNIEFLGKRYIMFTFLYIFLNFLI